MILLKVKRLLQVKVKMNEMASCCALCHGDGNLRDMNSLPHNGEQTILTPCVPGGNGIPESQLEVLFLHCPHKYILPEAFSLTQLKALAGSASSEM